MSKPTLNKYFIIMRIRELKITNKQLNKENLSFNEVIYRILKDDYSKFFIIKLAKILDCNIVDMYYDPDESIF